MYELFMQLYEYQNYSAAPQSFTEIMLLLAPEFFLIWAIYVYLFFVRPSKNFFFRCVFFYMVIVVLLVLLVNIGWSFIYSIHQLPQGFFFTTLIIDLYSTFSKLLVTLFLLLVCFFCDFKFTWKPGPRADIFLPLLFFLFFSFCLLSAADLIYSYMALEGVSLSLYTLVCNTYHKKVCIESAIKYFILGAAASGLYVYGSWLLVMACNSSNFGTIKYEFTSLSFNLCSTNVSHALLCFTFVFLFKVSGFPCNFWAPDVYSGVWLPITAVLVIVVKLLYFLFFFKFFFYVLIALQFLWQPLFVICSCGSLIIGSFGLLAQKKIKRFFAYSCIFNVSALLLAMSCGTLTSLALAILYLLVYSLTLVAFFGLALNTRCLITGECLNNVSDFANLPRSSDFGSRALLIVLFSLGGLPPFASFFVKYFVYIEAISSGYFLYILPNLLIGLVSSRCYLSFLQRIFFDEPVLPVIASLRFLNKGHTFIIIGCCLFLSFFVFIIQYLYSFSFMLAAYAIAPTFASFRFV